MNGSYGVIVGRFQVNRLHDGHRELFDRVFARHARVIVFLGVSPTGMTPEHPLDFATRAAMLRNEYPDLEGRSLTILPIRDVMTDEYWSKMLDEKIHEVVGSSEVVLYGGRDSFVPHYRGAHTPIELGLTKGVTGKAVREQLTNQILASDDFRHGVIYGAMNQYPRVIACVDVIVYYRDANGELQLLLGRKLGDPGWRFIGGHAEPDAPSFEADAQREAFEEGGVVPTRLEYIGSCLVPDWRWEREVSKIKTVVFAAEVMSLGASAGDDIGFVRWIRAREFTKDTLVKTHWPLYDLAAKHFGSAFGDPHASAQVELAATD